MMNETNIRTLVDRWTASLTPSGSAFTEQKYPELRTHEREIIKLLRSTPGVLFDMALDRGGNRVLRLRKWRTPASARPATPDPRREPDPPASDPLIRAARKRVTA